MSYWHNLIYSDLIFTYYKNTELKILPGYLVTDSYGMIVRKGNTELLNSINECLEELKSSGKIEEYIINHTK